MLGTLLRRVLGTSKERGFKRHKPILDAVSGYEPRYVAMSNDALRRQTALFKERLAGGESLEDLLPEAFAVVREVAKRVLGLRAFDVQILGALVLHQGTIAEMVTGEGKTLVATMPLYLNALEGRGVHLVTVNDYLALRDSQWMGPVFEFLGLTVGLIQQGMPLEGKQVAYRADITYGTNNEYGFDYLRDNMAMLPEHRVQRELHYAIVDEVDSILVDEARTPLIISGRPEKSTDIYLKVDGIVQELSRVPIEVEILDIDALLSRILSTKDILGQAIQKKLTKGSLSLIHKFNEGNKSSKETIPNEIHEAIAGDLKRSIRPKDEILQIARRETYKSILELTPPYELEEKGNHATLTEPGMVVAESVLDVENLYADDSLGIVHMIEQALRAHNFYKKDDEYVVRDGEVLIIDEFTGRIGEGRRWGDGLHQAIEAKERVPVQFETQTIASISYQNYFKLYEKLAGMTGTAFTEAAEFNSTYGLNVVQVPTNLPMNREDRTDLIFLTEEGKFRYVAREIEELHETGRPILVGTVSIEKSEHMANLLRENGIDDFQVLNAKYHEREAAIISNAGKMGAITIATNMAGRGTDIKLAEGVPELGGLAIIGTERHESRRIDNQLRGRAGRQGDAGTTRFYVSLEDEVARLFGGDRVKRLISRFGGDAMDEQPLDQRMVSRSIERAQRQVEEIHLETRKNLVKYDDVMNMQREVIYKIRRDVLEDRDISEQLREMFDEIVFHAVEEYAPHDVQPEDWDIEGMRTRLKAVFGFDFSVEDQVSGDPQTMAESFLDQVEKEYERREALIAEAIRKAYRKQIGGDESTIDFAKIARKRVHDFEMMSLLHAADSKWTDHLYSMDYLRESVRLRAMGQRDPLLEYKHDGFEMFQTLLLSIYETTIQGLFRLTDPDRHSSGAAGPGIRRKGPAPESDQLEELARYQYIGAEKEQDRSFASFDTSQFNLAGQGTEAHAGNGGIRSGKRAKERPKIQPVRRAGPKFRPNEPCPCGSGKKYKKCCGALT